MPRLSSPSNNRLFKYFSNGPPSSAGAASRNRRSRSDTGVTQNCTRGIDLLQFRCRCLRSIELPEARKATSIRTSVCPPFCVTPSKEKKDGKNERKSIPPSVG